jgi:DNA-binding NarL/FixJ family response regulator
MVRRATPIADRLESVRREADQGPSSLLSSYSRRGHGGQGSPEVHASRSFRDSGAPVGARPARHHALLDVVTRREIEVLQLMADGASNEQIARRLVISVGTVKSHVKRILRKLDASNRAEAVSCRLRSEYGRTSAGAS